MPAVRGAWLGRCAGLLSLKVMLPSKAGPVTGHTCDLRYEKQMPTTDSSSSINFVEEHTLRPSGMSSHGCCRSHRNALLPVLAWGPIEPEFAADRRACTRIACVADIGPDP
jgi:hypothetical protein